MHKYLALFLHVAFLICCWSANGAAQEESAAPSTSDELSATTTSTGTVSPTSTSGPDEVNGQIDLTLNGTIYPPTIFSGDVTIPKDLTVSCIDCAINGNISLSAGGSIVGDQITTPADVEQLAPNFDFKDYWAAATFDNLEATFDFAVNISASNPKNELDIPISTKAITRTFDFLTLTAVFNTEIHASINTTTDVNFTYGYKFAVPPGSEILVDLEHTNRSVSLGFNASTLTPSAFNTTTPFPSLSLSLSFRPSVTFIATIGAPGAHATVQLATTLDIPQLTANISQVHNATSSCSPPQSSTPADQIYQNLTLIAPSLNIDAFEVFSEIGKIPGLKLEANQPFSQTSPLKELAPVCLLFDQAKETLGPVPVTRPADVPSAAAGLGQSAGNTWWWAAEAMTIVAAVNMGL